MVENERKIRQVEYPGSPLPIGALTADEQRIYIEGRLAGERGEDCAEVRYFLLRQEVVATARLAAVLPTLLSLQVFWLDVVELMRDAMRRADELKERKVIDVIRATQLAHPLMMLTPVPEECGARVRIPDDGGQKTIAFSSEKGESGGTVTFGMVQDGAGARQSGRFNVFTVLDGAKKLQSAEIQGASGCFAGVDLIEGARLLAQAANKAGVDTSLRYEKLLEELELISKGQEINKPEV